MTKILSLSSSYQEALEEALKVLRDGKSLIYPTDTVYGIGCDATNPDALEDLYAIKQRDKGKPVSVLVGNLFQLKHYFHAEEHLELLMRYLPGPYTFILKAKAPLSRTIGEKVGVRVPAHFFCRKLAVELERPIVTTSANISGKQAASSFDQLDEILEKVPLAIDGGKLKHSVPSTVVDLVERKVVRQSDAPFSF